jgi:ferritin
MLTARIEQELNKQLNKESFSAYLYMSMGAYFQSIDLAGFANWMQIQAKEELFHAEKFYNFIHERDGKVTLEQIDKPQLEWESPLAAFQAALEHEIFITKSINNLADVALEEKDHATNAFLQWFINEQVEEEASANDIIRKLKLMKDAPGGLYLLDQELAARTLALPTDTAA